MYRKHNWPILQFSANDHWYDRLIADNAMEAGIYIFMMKTCFQTMNNVRRSSRCDRLIHDAFVVTTAVWVLVSRQRSTISAMPCNCFFYFPLVIWTRPSTYPSNRSQIVRVTRRVQLVLQELLTLLEHLISLPLWTNLSWVRVIHFVTLHCLNVYSSVLWCTVRVPSKTMLCSSNCLAGVHDFLCNLYLFQHTTVHIIWWSCRLAVTRQLVEQELLPSGAHEFTTIFWGGSCSFFCLVF